MVTTSEGQKRRGWPALLAGPILLLVAGAVWIWVDRLFAADGGVLTDTSTMQLLGKLNVAFALLATAGVLGTINGWRMVRTGKRSNMLVWALVVASIGTFLTAYGAVTDHLGG